MSNNLAIGLALCLATASVVWACGVDFPTPLLDDRVSALKATPVRNFASQAALLVPPADSLRVHDDRHADVAANPEDATAARGPTAEQLQLMQELTLDEAGGIGDTVALLPEELQLYARGAHFFHGAWQIEPQRLSTDASCKAACRQARQRYRDALTQAQGYFERILALPPEQSQLRSAHAAYSLGRIHAALATLESDPRAQIESAVGLYRQVRERVLAGAADDDDLAVSSYGQEARLHLYRERIDADGTHRFCLWQHPECEAPFVAERFVDAIHLYAEQAARGAYAGVNSLRFMGRTALFVQPDLLPVVVADPVAQRMLVDYALAYSLDDGADEGADPLRYAPSRLEPLVDAIEASGVPVAGADKLAALAYRTGRYDLAARLVDTDTEPTPLACWIKAKLALQRGDPDAAATAYAEAAKAFSTLDNAYGEHARVIGEQGVLALAREDYVEAMRLLYAARERVQHADPHSQIFGYADDASYVAERVLTINELKMFVDTQVHATPLPAAAADKETQTIPYSEQLRWLLARRLLRAGRYDEAIGYFPIKGDPRFAARLGDLDLQTLAREYAQAVRDGNGWTRIGRAEALYKAATLANRHGMELLGFEQTPDHADRSGHYSVSGFSAEDLRQPYVSEDERIRFAATLPQPDYRFQYRFTAVDMMEKAADNLPPRSQAFAAVLCKGFVWMHRGPLEHRRIDGEPLPNLRDRRAEAVYMRYLDQGAQVPWTFGRDCPEPEFGRARDMQRVDDLRAAKRFVRANGAYGIVIVVLCIGLAAWIVARRRLKARAA